MNRRELLKTSGAFVAASLAGCIPRRQSAPNLLVICVDDCNHWVSYLNSPQKAFTPWIDKLASQGTVFEKAYCAAPYCNSSRMAVLTGSWPSKTGIYKDERFWQSEHRQTTFLEAIRRDHYYTFGAGKILHGKYNYGQAHTANQDRAIWEDRENRTYLWDHFEAMAAEPLPRPFPQNGILQASDGSSWSPQFDWGVLKESQEARHPDVITAAAVEALLRKPKRLPFLCMAGFYKPHLPWYAPQRWLDHYPLSQIVLPKVDRNDLDDVPAQAKAWALNPPDQTTLDCKGLTAEAVQAYKAAISFTDEQIGKVLTALWQSPERDNTIVALWSDNGFHLGEKMHWRKFTLWEEATLVPLIIADPRGGPYKKRIDTPVSLIDLFPTLFDLAGLPAVEGVDGHSLRPLMLGLTHTAPTPVVMTWGQGNHSLRQGQWRYISYAGGGEELYDHSQDPLEHHNLSGSVQHAAVKHRLGQALAQALKP